ncbi:MAG: transglutaminase-like domain-containing protein [Planctomycetota bacterium]
MRHLPTLALLALPACLASCRSAAETLDVAAPEEPAESRFRFEYTASLHGVEAAADTARLWIPVPVDNDAQDVSQAEVLLRAEGPGGTRDARLPLNEPFELTVGEGERALHVTHADLGGGAGRSVCVEAPGGEALTLVLSFEVLRRATGGGGAATEDELRAALEPDTYVPLDGKVAAVAGSLATADDPAATARALYDHTLERMRYEKPVGGSWGRGDAEWACDSRHGNCTDFHSYFLGLARVKGIPARFEMGFSVPARGDEASVGGYHCWAFFWDGERWVPVDISEADKHPERAEFYFGALDPDRVTMTGGRDLVLDPPAAQGPLNFFVYPYAEVDGKIRTQGLARSFRRFALER